VRLLKYKEQRKPEEQFFFRFFFFRLIAGTIDRSINITIFVYVQTQRFKEMLPLKMPEEWLFWKLEVTDNATAY